MGFGSNTSSQGAGEAASRLTGSRDSDEPQAMPLQGGIELLRDTWRTWKPQTHGGGWHAGPVPARWLLTEVL